MSAIFILTAILIKQCRDTAVVDLVDLVQWFKFSSQFFGLRAQIITRLNLQPCFN